MHNVAEALAEPPVGKVEAAPDADDAGRVDDGHGGREQGGQTCRPARRQLPIVMNQVDLQGRLQDVAQDEQDADPAVRVLMGGRSGGRPRHAGSSRIGSSRMCFLHHS